MFKKIDKGFRIARFKSIHNPSTPSKAHIVREVAEGKTPHPWCGTSIQYAHSFQYLKEPGVNLNHVSCSRCLRRWTTRVKEELF